MNDITLSNGIRVPKPIAKRMAATDLVATSETIAAAIKLDAQNAVLHKGYSTALAGAQLGQQVFQELEQLGPIAEPYIQALFALNQAYVQGVLKTCQHSIDQIARISPNGKGGS